MPSARRDPVPERCVDCGRLRLGHDPGADPPASDRSADGSACRCGAVDWVTVPDPPAPVVEPDLEAVLRTVFGITELGMEVCIRLMDVGEASAREVAEGVDADRSTVARHLDHLVALGVLEADQRIPSGGGRVTVYRTAPAAVVRERFAVGLYHWLAAAVRAVEDLSEEKVRAVGRAWTDDVDDPDDGSGDVYYRPDS